MLKWSSLLLSAALLAAPLSGCSRFLYPQLSAQEGGAASGAVLNRVKTRGRLSCGVSGNLPGFSYVTQQGEYNGLDVDICRAIAAAMFDDPQAVDFRNLNAKERFTALQAGEIDVLSRNTTWTISRDTSTGLEFAPTVFYDGQGMMVKQDSGIKDLKGLQGRSVCVQTGTSTEQNLSDQMRKLGVKYTPIVFEDDKATFAAYQQGRCEGVTSDRSQLVAQRSALPNPDEHVLLEIVMSKEPLAPAVRNNDPQWYDTVKWVIFGLIEAEELGITSQNIDSFANSEDPVVRRLLGTEGDLGQGLGLTNDFIARAIREVGNYGEIYNRNLGPDTQLNLPRGQNELWTDGGLHYAPPFR
ncbi:amino acid ABC transporter substrate-binding protein [Gloeocapsopsis sp. IPPAS B-1203]|uniref:amino acid ABC transporter substrate-binding protein n=1 Tax=Gloeocapsopsis sp. IPPAS B-1203 TaxID=2049454 RepID=UPI000C19EB0D|nr:amino acid ABC transporter substrate-binding protein [Gloeocapsopsis sp. IPPAS B-1203]PIG93017.1 amino acid ABC transporter substrate-binding protein [Gloeocapsopsis sp. IPPAS B-1203]